MKTVLISPPTKHMLKTTLPKYIEEERGAYPPLGLMYLASYLKERGEDITVLDGQFLDYSQIESALRRIKPDIVGIQALSFTLIDALYVARIVRKIDKRIIIVFGGRHPTLFPQETVNLPEVDIVVQGEGEIPFHGLVKNIHNKDALKKVKGLVFMDGKQIINTGFATIPELDTLPFPDIDSLLLKKYKCLISKKGGFMTMITSRGCPFNCTFCDEKHSVFRSRSAKNVVDEIETYVASGIKNIFFYDATFSINKTRAIAICDEIITRNIKVNIELRTRVDLVDDDILKKLKQAGCIRIQYGIESGSDHILKNLNKHTTVEKITAVVQKTEKYGFEILADFMIGCPGEKKEDIERTIAFACALPIDYAHFTILTPYPATELYHEGLKRGIIKTDYWRRFAEHPQEDFEPKIWEEHFKREELTELLNTAYKRFYTRPTYIAKQFLKMRSFHELKKKTKAGLILLKHTSRQRM